MKSYGLNDWRRLAAVWLLFLALPVAALERVHNYDVDIQIHQDATMTVTETIEVAAEGNQIRRGIYRDFPTRYQDKLWNKYKVGFDVLEVLRDGRSEPWHTKNTRNGVRVYVGSASTYLSPGRYTYTIKYATNRQLGFFEEHDELYWNAVGPDWTFPISKVNVLVNLPDSAGVPEFIQTHLYSGGYGSKDSEGRAWVDDAGVHFESTRGLNPYQGFTIVVGWPKGLIPPPTAGQRIKWFLSDNRGVLVALIALALVLGFYLRFWSKVGRDLPEGTIIPRFEPPAGMSPAACRYVYEMGFDRRTLTAAIISLAVKGQLTIEQIKKEYSLRKTAAKPRVPLSRGEKKLLAELFPGVSSRLELKNENHRRLRAGQSALGSALALEYRGKLFKTNLIYFLIGLLLSGLLTLITVAMQAPPWAIVALVVLLLGINLLFLYLLKAPTPPGRKIMDDIEGFQMYLETAERDRLEQMKSPEMTPEIFEMFLPFAYALGVANDWSKAFKRYLEGAMQDPESGYHPHWYSGGDAGDINFLNKMGSSLNSGLNSAVGTASSPPGSSSGGGGGGSSGGGGGGGGGGGW